MRDVVGPIEAAVAVFTSRTLSTFTRPIRPRLSSQIYTTTTLITTLLCCRSPLCPNQTLQRCVVSGGGGTTTTTTMPLSGLRKCWRWKWGVRGDRLGTSIVPCCPPSYRRGRLPLPKMARKIPCCRCLRLRSREGGRGSQLWGVYRICLDR